VKLPDLTELLSLRGPARHARFQAPGRSRALLLGSHRGTQRGRGLEFEEVRAYVAGDDIRRIDWRVTARRGRPHTKLFREERERPVWLVVDLQPAMYFGSRGQLKSMVAVRAAALLAWIAATDGDRVGAIISSGAEQRCLPPRGREQGVLPILNALLALQPTAPATAAPRSLREALTTLAPLVRPGSLVLAISDFSDASDAGDTAWYGLAAHSDCRLFWVTDPLEQRALPDGRFRAGAGARSWSIDGATVRSRWLAAWHEREARVNALAQRLRMPLTRLDTSQTVQNALQLPLPSREPSFAA
jgi:uncharacterized protein (DUF58 family)